jgi:hypothetical protein
MLDRVTGKVVHIDFGDCFEITSQRSKFPEIVPFRLTRMLQMCMDASGIEGTYRLTAERVMSVLRENRDSVMAMLEAFVYDPLISWRLLANETDAGDSSPFNGSFADGFTEKDINGDLNNSVDKVELICRCGMFLLLIYHSHSITLVPTLTLLLRHPHSHPRSKTPSHPPCPRLLTRGGVFSTPLAVAPER